MHNVHATGHQRHAPSEQQFLLSCHSMFWTKPGCWLPHHRIRYSRASNSLPDQWAYMIPCAALRYTYRSVQTRRPKHHGPVLSKSYSTCRASGDNPSQRAVTFKRCASCPVGRRKKLGPNHVFAYRRKSLPATDPVKYSPRCVGKPRPAPQRPRRI